MAERTSAGEHLIGVIAGRLHEVGASIPIREIAVSTPGQSAVTNCTLCVPPERDW